LECAKYPAQLIVIKDWVLSGGAVNYLGEWHTHPESKPTQFLKDCENWLKLAYERKEEIGNLCFELSVSRLLVFGKLALINLSSLHKLSEV